MPTAKTAKTAEPIVTLTPSAVLRLQRKGTLPYVIKGATLMCRNGHPSLATTYDPSFWENGTYIGCAHCDKKVLALPIFPVTEHHPAFMVDVSGERKKYPLYLAE